MKSIKIIYALLVAIILAACSGKGEEKIQELITDLKLPVKADIVGAIGEGTSMNVLELVDANGDTMTLETDNGRFFGDKDVGDSVIVSYLTIDGELISSTVVNMKNLIHTWAMEPEEGTKTKYMEIDPKGFVHIFVDKIENLKYEKWVMNDGMLILLPPEDSLKTVQPDTMEILSLNADTMKVRKAGENITLWRYN